MSRPLLPLALLLSLPAAGFAQEARPDPIVQKLAVQQALAAAEDHLTRNAPADAVAALETQLANADGSRAFLDALRRAYSAELRQLDAASAADPERVAALRKKLGLLGGSEPTVPVAAPVAAPAAVVLPEVPPAADPATRLQDARAKFKQGKYAEAATLFAAARGQAALTEDEAAAWAYCRVRVAADAVNRPGCPAADAAAAEKDVAEALLLAPNSAELQKVGQAVLAVARSKAAGARGAETAAAPAATPADWETIETASFRVRFKGNRDTADAVAKAAEAKREETFKRWSGPPAGAWAPKCEIVLHPNADCYAGMTGRPAAGTGHAAVRLDGGRATARRIDLRADDTGVVANALPRELTHVVLADLFPSTPPPKWAEEGMAVLAGSPEEADRFARTLPRCHRDGQLFAVAALLEMKEFPAADKVTGFYCESASLVDYLVKLRGEANFTIFLRDCQRYGSAKALERQYGIAGPQALEQAWKPAALGTARGQAPSP